MVISSFCTQKIRYFCIISLDFSLALAQQMIDLVPPLPFSRLFLTYRALFLHVRPVSYTPQSLHRVLLWIQCTILLSCDMCSFVVAFYYSSAISHHFPLGVIGHCNPLALRWFLNLGSKLPKNYLFSCGRTYHWPSMVVQFPFDFSAHFLNCDFCYGMIVSPTNFGIGLTVDRGISFVPLDAFRVYIFDQFWSQTQNTLHESIALPIFIRQDKVFSAA